MTLKLILCILTVYIFVSCQTKDADVNISVPPQEKTQTPETEKKQDKEIVKTDELQELIELSFEGKDKVKENDDVTLLGKPLSQYILDPKTDPDWKSVLEPTIQYYKSHAPEIAEYIEKSMSSVSIVQSPVPLTRLRVDLLNENIYHAKIISRSENHIWIDSVLFNELKLKEKIEIIQKEILARMMIQQNKESSSSFNTEWDGSWTEIFEKLQKNQFKISNFYSIENDLKGKIELLINLDFLSNQISKYTKNDFLSIFNIVLNLSENNQCLMQIQTRNNQVVINYNQSEIVFKEPLEREISYQYQDEIVYYKIKNVIETYELDVQFNKNSKIYTFLLYEINENGNATSHEHSISCNFQGVSQ